MKAFISMEAIRQKKFAARELPRTAVILTFALSVT